MIFINVIIITVAPGPVVTLQNDSTTQTCVTLSWTYGFNGNALITGVNINYRAIDNSNTAHNGSTTTDQTSITICNLQPLTVYQFNVTVSNEVSNTVGVSSSIIISVETLSLSKKYIINNYNGIIIINI